MEQRNHIDLSIFNTNKTCAYVATFLCTTLQHVFSPLFLTKI